MMSDLLGFPISGHTDLPYDGALLVKMHRFLQIIGGGSVD